MSITIENISKSYGDLLVLKDFSFKFEAGITGILSPSGSGKTTLLRLIAGLEKPDEGSISLAGKIAIMFQEDRLLPAITVLENVAVVIKNNTDEAEQWLKKVDLWNFKDALPKELSGGMQRCTTLARTFAYGGDIILLDEPFKGLDGVTKEKMMVLTKKALQGKTAIIVTHDPKELQEIADTIIKAEGIPFKIIETKIV